MRGSVREHRLRQRSMDFQTLCTFDTYKSLWSHYGYGGDLRDVLEQEFTRIKGITYLDHAATTLYPESLVRDYFQDVSRNVYGNPHSHHPSSRLTQDTVDRVRYRVLQHFNATPEEYSVIFTSGCTAALKLVAESFPWRPQTESEAGSRFCYLTDSHTSVVGIRGLASVRGAVALPVAPREVESRARATSQDAACQTPHLFSYPAQSNFSGRKYPLGLVRGIQARRLYPACDHRGRWFVLLDAASHVSCSPLDLRQCPADFIPISFYKMFGFPTGLGALLVRNDAAGVLKKTYFGGGTAAAYLSGEDYYVQAANVSDRFEDGTVSFLDIIAVNHGFDGLYRITGGMHNIQQHTYGLARYTYMLLSSLCHGNRRAVAQIYTEGQFESPNTQGAILNFNLRDSHGQIIGYSQVDSISFSFPTFETPHVLCRARVGAYSSSSSVVPQVDTMASLYDIHVRTGCFCNTGACQFFIGITNEQMRKNLNDSAVMARKRVFKKEGSSSANSRVQGSAGDRKEPKSSGWWLKRGALAIIAVFFLVPCLQKQLPGLIQHFVYSYRIRVPLFVDLSRPADLSLNHTINTYLTSEEGISLGVWHTVPDRRWKEAQGKDLEWYQNTLKDGSPVFIYLHGNTGSRAETHRVGVAKVLSALGYHVLVPDYRGFGDSTGEPTEAGLTTDALYLYNWVKARSGNSLVIIWGHSLGTGVGTNTAVKLIERGEKVDGVMLEGAFNSARDPIPGHPFSWYYWKYPGIGYFFQEPWAENKVVFPTEENLKKMRSPILFLHAEDDHLVPIQSVRQMYEVAVSAQNAERVQLASFDGSLGYLHNGLYRDPHLPDIVKNFVLSL